MDPDAEASAPALAKPLQPKSEKDISKLKLKLLARGASQRSSAADLSGHEFVLLVIGVLIGGARRSPSTALHKARF